MFSPKWLNELRFGYYRDYFLFGAVLPGTNFTQEAGITGYEQTDLSPSFPLINLSGYTGFNGSGSNNLPKSNRIRTYEYADAVSLQHRQTRIEIRRPSCTIRPIPSSTDRRRRVRSASQRNIPATPSAIILLGYPASVFRAYPLALYGNNGNEWALFTQDTYRLSRNLTLNLGIRYAHNPFFNGTQGQTSAFDYATGKVIVPMVNGKLIDPVVQPETPFLLPLFTDRLEGTDHSACRPRSAKRVRDSGSRASGTPGIRRIGLCSAARMESSTSFWTPTSRCNGPRCPRSKPRRPSTTPPPLPPSTGRIRFKGSPWWQPIRIPANPAPSAWC